jgi:ribonucleoside-diphosphate reductase alpha chain
MVSHKEAMHSSLEYFNNDDLAAQVYVGKYALTTPEGDIQEPTPDLMHKRLAKEFARIESKYPNPLSEDEIFTLLDRFKYIIPQGSPMSGIGNSHYNTTLSNCYTLEPTHDSYGGILKTDQELVQLMKRRAGVGVDISNIRPKGRPTSNAAKTTDGLGVFMERFSNSCREVAQNGRRGALILTISCHHPEIETFINIKRDLKKVTGANISIRLTDEFMNAVKNKTSVELRFPVDSKNPTVSVMRDACELWEQIINSAHANAEPGLLFWDTVLKNTPSDCYPEFKSVGVNPCSEIILSKNDSCRLLLINASSFVLDPFSANASFDWEQYSEIVVKAQRLMDDLIDLELECIERILLKIESDPEPEEIKRAEFMLWKDIKSTCERGRRTGLGLTGIGDALAFMNVQYGSDESIALVEKIYQNLALNAYRSSVAMAKERGAFPAFNHELEKDHSFITKIMDLDPKLKAAWSKYGRRNIALTTTAPAGSVSLLTQTTSGIEPAFLLSYKRRKKINPQDIEARVDFVDELGDKWQEFTVYHHGFKKWMEVTGKQAIKDSPYWKATSNDINWVKSVELQGAAQKWICHAISKTCNLPEDTTVDTVRQVYEAAWTAGCKGFTVYRDGSRTGVLVSAEETKKKPETEEIVLGARHAPRRPAELPCDIHTTTVKGEKWTFFVGLLEGKPYEIMGGLTSMINLPKRVRSGKIVKHNGQENPIARYDLHYDYDRGPEDETTIRDITNVFDNATHASFTRTISLAMRHGAPVQYLVEQIVKGSEKEDDLFSFSRAISRVLKAYIQDGTKASGSKKCPSCGSEHLVYQEGCLSCKNCGFSKCS